MIDLFGRVQTMVPAVDGARHELHPGWPEVTCRLRLPSGVVLRLRPLVWRDGRVWREQRLLDERWLRPVEPTQAKNWAEAQSTASWKRTFSTMKEQAQHGVLVPLVIEVDGRFAGQVTIGNIQHGTVSSAWIGYWVHSAYMGQGVATAACALGADHSFSRIGLHRLDATYLPDNPASGRVLENNGFRVEGFLRQNLHIDGEWRDHHYVALLSTDFEGTCVDRLISTGRASAWRD